MADINLKKGQFYCNMPCHICGAEFISTFLLQTRSHFQGEDESKYPTAWYSCDQCGSEVMLRLPQLGMSVSLASYYEDGHPTISVHMEGAECAWNLTTSR